MDAVQRGRAGWLAAPVPLTPHALLHGAAAAALILAVVLFTFAVAYPSPSAAVRMLGYVLLFNLLPGIVAARLILPRLEPPGLVVAYAGSAGIVVSLLAFMPLWIAGSTSLFWTVPVLSGLAAVVLWRRLRLAELVGAAARLRLGPGPILDLLLVCVTPLLTVGFLVGADTTTGFSDHFAFQGVLVQSLARGWPPPYLALGDVQLSYNYAAHLWVLAAREITGLPVEVLVVRLAPLFLFGAAIAALLGFARHALGLAPGYARLVVVAVFWIVGVPRISGQVFATFTAFGAGLIMSPSLGFITVFLILTVILDRLETARLNLWTAGPLLAALAFVATGARGPSGPVLLCALCLLFLVHGRRHDGLPRRVLLLALPVAAGFAAGLCVFFTLGSEFSGSGFAQLTGHPFRYLAEQEMLTLPYRLIRLGVPDLAAGAVAFLVIVAFQAGFFMPGLVHKLRDLARETPRDAEVLLWGAALAGIAAVFLTVAPGYSHFTFLPYANIALTLLGAVGLQHALVRQGGLRGPVTTTKTVLVAATLGLAVLQLAQMPRASLAWLSTHARLALTSFAQPGRDLDPQERTIAPCMREEDAALVGIAERAGDEAVLVLLGEAPSISNCESRWWIVRHPVRTVQMYSLRYLSGQPRGALKERLERRRAHLASAIAAAEDGRFPAGDLIAVTKTLPGRPVFVMAPQRARGEDSRFEAVGETDRFRLMRIRPSEAPTPGRAGEGGRG